MLTFATKRTIQQLAVILIVFFITHAQTHPLKITTPNLAAF
jgi:hypothetical protein